MNILLGLLLELNGIRCRGVAGFDPVLREIYPGAGHSSIEFLNAASNKWEYLDAYLDIHLKGRAACDLPDDPIAQNITIADVGSEFDHMRYGAHINIARIFRYRLYFDFAERLPMASMLRLGPREDAYGRTWRLITTTSRSQVHAAEPVRTLYVRARYIVGQSAISTKHPVLTIAPVASEWTYGKIYF